MEHATAKILLENLVLRLERAGEDNKWKLEGVISDSEKQSLSMACDVLGVVSENPVTKPKTDRIAVAPDAEKEPVILNLDSIQISEPEDSDVLLCLDFGTAMSKAFATDGFDDELLDLKIGRRAGQTDPIYSLLSTMFITNSGQILFGQKALSESTQGSSESRQRLDSIKDILCKDVVHDLDSGLLDKEQNPTETPLTKGDVVTLFLAYFTDMAVSELQSSDFSKSRYVRRRFTRPVLPQERSLWADEQLRKLLARAQILADTLHGKWDDGIDVDYAKELIDAIKNQDEIPEFLIDEGVVEPVAAIGSRVRDYICPKNLRRLLMVVDVGAGTIDFALFAELHKEGQPLRVWEIPGSIQVLRQAGDMVDKLLRRHILKLADISTTDSDFHMISAGLSLRIRQIKEDLFNYDTADYLLTNDADGKINLDGFLEEDGVKGLEKAIHEKFREVLNNVDPSWLEDLGRGVLTIIFTGGGGKLPMIRSLANGEEVIDGIALKKQASVDIPKWIIDDYPELQNEYPHLAVAIGGASRSVPVLAPQSFDKFGGLEVDGWTIETALKGT